MGQLALPFQPITAIAALLRRGELSPVELVAAVLQRIERLDPILHAYITLLPEQAMDAARRSEAEIRAGRYRGPLHGIPIAHKDVFHVRGVRTTAHSRVLRDYVADEDAPAVRRLAEAGAITLGKANTYEFGNGATAVFGTPVNPWDTARVTGGSSAGSASAVAAGLCLGATGTDGGGSLRTPAAFCGVVGLKPTTGLVSSAGTVCYAPSLSVAGPMARTVRDCAILLDGMASGDRRDRSTSDESRPGFLAALGGIESDDPATLAGLRVGVPRQSMPGAVEPITRAAVETALRQLAALGADVREVEVPVDPMVADAAHVAIERPEALPTHRSWLRERSHDYAPLTRQRLLVGACVGTAERDLALAVRADIRRTMISALGDVDLLAGPTVPCPAWRLEQPQLAGTLFTKPVNLAGLPAISVPCGFTPDAQPLPIGLQLIGRPFDEITLFRAADAYERSCAWTTIVPPDWSRPAYPAGTTFPAAAITDTMGTRDRKALREEVRRALQAQELPVLEEDIDQVALGLHAIRAGLRRASSRPPGRETRE